MRKIGVLLTLLLALLAAAGIANASPISYTFQGTGTGDLGGVSFTNASFTITVFGDTNNVQDLGGGLLVNIATSAQVAIQGFQTADFTIATQVFDNQSVSVLGFERAPNEGDLLDLTDSAFATYDLKTAIGPIVVADPFFGQFNCDFGCVSTTQGNLTFTDMGAVTFNATGVPEPTTLALVGAGVVGLARRLRMATRS